MPAAVAASWQSDPDHPLVRLETAASGPGHAMSLQETPSDPCSTSATVILSPNPPKGCSHVGQTRDERQGKETVRA